VDRLFTWKRARVYGLLLCALYLVAYVSVTVQGTFPLNSSREPIGGDYIAFYTAGRLVFSDQLYDHTAVSAFQSELLGGQIPGFYDAYRNPPFYALPFVALSALDLIPSFVVWTVLSLGLLALAVFLVARRRWLDVMILSLAFGPVYFGLIDGENATVSLLLYVLIYRSLLRDQRARAGVWAALGLFKPQLFFIWPIVFVASRRWRALLAYVAVSLLLLAISFAAVGADGLQAWLSILVDMESGNATRNAWRMHSLKAFFDLLLPSVPLASWLLYAACSAVLLALVARVWSRRPTDLALPFAFTTAVAVLVDPHLVDYDLSVLVVPALLAIPVLPALRWWALLLYPLLLFRAALPLGPSAVQLSTLALAACAVVLARRLLADQRRPALDASPAASASPWQSRLTRISSHTQV
jgi:hypothetical protein